MKKTIIKILVTAFLLVTTLTTHTSCDDYLDVDKYFFDQLSLDSAFTKKQYVDGWLANAYEHLTSDLGEFNNDLNYASDEIIYNHQNIKDLQFGNYNSEQLRGLDRFGRQYESIRKASTFIANIDKCRDLTYEEIADYKAQALFLRAYGYWSLVRMFGPVPLIPVEGLDVSLSYEELSLPRNHFDDCINRIEEDLILAARNLPATRTTNNLGRPTLGAALALRARVLLFAASPMYNGNTDFYNLTDHEGNVLVSQEYDERKWAKAAAAAKEVMDLGRYDLLTVETPLSTPYYERPPAHPVYSVEEYPNGWANIDPALSYKGNFDGQIQPSKNPELIFCRTSSGRPQTLANNSTPRSLSGGNKIGVTQKTVDAYYMNDGRTIYEAEATGDYKKIGFTESSSPELEGGYPFVGNEVSLMYVNREPRFYASIAFSGARWAQESANEAIYRNQQVFYYKDHTDGLEGKQNENCPLTGISMIKYCNKEDAYTKGGYSMNKAEPTIRYAEILLIYAEALNELTPGVKHTVTSYKNTDMDIEYSANELQKAIKPIRMRAGIPDLDPSIYANQREFKNRLKLERRIELFAENAFRYTDLRRWKDADVEESQALMGCNMNIPYDQAIIQRFYEPTVVTAVPKVFSKKMYLLPFPKHELKRNIRLTQNPGW